MKKRILTILLGIVISVILLSGCEISFKQVKLRNRDNKSAKETILSSGEWEVGKDITEGRYDILSKEGTNNLMILDPESNGISDVFKNVYTILDSKGENGVESITCNLKQGQIVKISGTTKVNFIPSETKANNRLTSGDWEVGIDITPGKYRVKSEKESGNFIILNKDRNKARINEVLDLTGDNGVKSLECELKDGEIIELRGVHTVVFEHI